MSVLRSREYGARGVEPNLGRIHQIAFTRKSEIVAMLELAKESRTEFQGGLGPFLDRERAQLKQVTPEALQFSVQNFDLDKRERVVLTFLFKGDLFLISILLLDSDAQSRTIKVSLPSTVYRVERRDRERKTGGITGDTPSRARLRWRQIVVGDARVVDYSGDGIALELTRTQAARLSQRVELSFVDGPESGIALEGIVRHRKSRSKNLEEVGLSISAAPPGPLISIERRGKVIPRSAPAELRERWRVGLSSAGVAATRVLRRLGPNPSNPPKLDVVRFENALGEQLVALRDSWQPQPGATCVVMPPAWAKTKETLLPLARTIVATFKKARVPVVVFRFDGIRRRGESHNDSENRVPGKECHAMTFSQGVRDIQATLDFLSQSPEHRDSRVVLVTFSGAAIEARKVLSDEVGDRVCGWVSVVGAADLHGGLRVVSGGQDYIGGFDRGVRFGIQRILGIETDIDLVCKDALDQRLAYLEDARCQMAKVTVPISWIQGRHDAWIDPQRVREILSCGSQSGRRLFEVPTGHRLRSSKEALDVFQLVASEVGRFATGHSLPPALPGLADLERRRISERERIPGPDIDLKSFWREYLLGREQLPGMEVLTATKHYRNLMAVQVRHLDLRRGDRVADLGAGIGTFSLFLASQPGLPDDIEVHQYDFLNEALCYGRSQLLAHRLSPTVRSVVCDLGSSVAKLDIPVRNDSYDAILASLLLNYVREPGVLLAEARRAIRAGGRLVVSALRKDTDISGIYIDAANEIRMGKVNLGDDLPPDVLDAAVRSFLNEAARLVDLEEQGVFTFWDSEELSSLVRDAGFDVRSVRQSFGEPAQATVVSAIASV